MTQALTQTLTAENVTQVDWREKRWRQAGFDLFYRFHVLTNDFSPDINVERWIADDLGWDFEQRCVMALFHGATYAGPCESMFAVEFPKVTRSMGGVTEFFQKNKKRLLFSPDCKYRKLVFEQFLETVGISVRPYGTLGRFVEASLQSGNEQANYVSLKERCQGAWYHWGRMGHWCFTEALKHFVDAPLEPPDMEFYEGKSHRSGWAFCVGMDHLTGDKASREDCNKLERSAAEYLDRLELPRADRLNLETACCNYKRQHKGSRYGGCYIDEQHAETMQMMKDWPEYQWLWEKYLEGRRAVIPSDLLYECQESDVGGAYRNDWNRSLADYGRMPRVEAWINGERQRWCSLSEMPFATAS